MLGVPRDATAEAIRAAYRKLALKYHPDKSHASEDPEQAAERFKEISTAHGILSDPEKRRKYDVGGFAAMEPSDLDMEIDISQLGVAGTAFAAMFSRLGKGLASWHVHLKCNGISAIRCAQHGHNRAATMVCCLLQACQSRRLWRHKCLKWCASLAFVLPTNDFRCLH